MIDIEQQALLLIKQGQTASYIRDTLGISENIISRIKRENRPPVVYVKDKYLPPTEQAIEMLENGYSKQEVQEAWGEEVLSEALSFYEIPSVEEYIKKFNIE